MLTSQRHLFSLPENIHYLNGAYMSPQLKSVEQIGIEALSRKNFPHTISPTDFFTGTEQLRRTFAELVHAPDPSNTAIIPSVSYGIATVANNIDLQPGQEVLMVGEQFPSNVYAWKHLTTKNKAYLNVIKAPLVQRGRAAEWNNRILAGINGKTAIVSMPHIHWADGTLFDLKAIRKKTRQYNALLVIDGSQSIGAFPFSVADIEPDALITVGYKWMLGPYSLGMAYLSDYFNEGMPIENNWINRYNSEDFSKLVHYEDLYQPKAGRYNMGENSNFNLTPMLTGAIQQLLKWNPENIQSYCHTISKNAVEYLRSLGCFIEEDSFRAKHLFGVYLPEHIKIASLKTSFAKNNVYVSIRGNAIRISPNVYNTEGDFEKLISCFKNTK